MGLEGPGERKTFLTNRNLESSGSQQVGRDHRPTPVL